MAAGVAGSWNETIADAALRDEVRGVAARIAYGVAPTAAAA
jgi:hypothetical protein